MKISSLQSTQGMYGLASLDTIAALKEYWGINTILSEPMQMIFLEPALTQLTKVAGDIVTGLILDPSIGLAVASNSQSGLILPLSIQKSPELDPLALPQVDQNWGVVEIANNYGVAMLTLYYNPQEEKALQKKKFVAEFADYCRYEHIDFILDLVIYTPAEQQFDISLFQAAQITALQELRFAPTAFILQYPLDPLACATLTTELDIPWLVSSKGLRYPEFKETLRTSLEGGAAGFCVHELSWPTGELDTELLSVANEKNDIQAIQEISQDWFDSVSKELTTTVRDQLIELMRITNEFGTQVE